MKKLIVAMLVTYVVLMGTNYLIHGVLLMPDYDVLRPVFRSVEGVMARFWAIAVGQVFFAVAFVWVFVRGLERKSWLVQGIRFGIIASALVVIPQALSQYDTFPVTYMLTIKWMLLESVQMVVLGIVVAAFYRSAVSRA